MEEHRPKKLLDQVRDAIRLKHYSYRTKQAYVGWIKRYIYFHDVRHPSEIGAPKVEAFLTHLAVRNPWIHQLPGVDLVTHSYRQCPELATESHSHVALRLPDRVV